MCEDEIKVDENDGFFNEASLVKAELISALEKAQAWKKKSRERSLVVTKIQETMGAWTSQHFDSAKTPEEE